MPEHHRPYMLGPWVSGRGPHWRPGRCKTEICPPALNLACSLPIGAGNLNASQLQHGNLSLVG